MRDQAQQPGGIATMSYLFAAVLLFSSPGCPHEEPTCLTPTEYVEVNFRIDEYVDASGSRDPRRHLSDGY
jgi:hypothetical protein